MSWNAIAPIVGALTEELNNSLGITQFQGTTSWFQTMGGLVIQGGLVNVPSNADVSVTFPAPLSQQILGIFLEERDTATVQSSSLVSSTLTGFTFCHTGSTYNVYWLAIGV